MKRVSATVRSQHDLALFSLLVGPHTINPIILRPKMRGRVPPQARRKDMMQFAVDSVESTQLWRRYVWGYDSPWVSGYSALVGRRDILH